MSPKVFRLIVVPFPEMRKARKQEGWMQNVRKQVSRGSKILLQTTLHQRYGETSKEGGQTGVMALYRYLPQPRYKSNQVLNR